MGSPCKRDGQSQAEWEWLVRTRSDCEPHGQKLNHCRHTIDLSDGSRIDVIDHHEVARYRSMRPGESIILLRFNSDWVVAQVSGS